MAKKKYTYSTRDPVLLSDYVRTTNLDKIINSHRENKYFILSRGFFKECNTITFTSSS